MEFVALDEFWGDIEFDDGGSVWVIFDVADDEVEGFVRCLGRY